VRTLFISTVLATSGLAAAQPAAAPPPPAPAAPGTCSVTIVRAPDGVRQTIEQWLAREHCTVALQVRIIPTEGGLYLLATDEHGRVRERIVPDASSAGVLIASWAADDGLGGATPGPPPPSAPAPMAPPAPIAPMAPSYSAPAYTGPAPMAGAPSAYGPGAEFRPPSAYEPIDGPVLAVPPAYPNTYLTLSAGLGSNASGTLRGELDYYGKSGWGIGLLFGLTGSSMDVQDYAGYGSAYTASVTDYTFAVALGRQWRSGAWHLRGTMALGVVESTMALNQYDYSTDTYGSSDGSVASPYVEASLRAGRSFGASNQWALEGGLVFSYTKQEWYLQDAMSTLYREAGNVEVIVGVRHGL
jgi:hypothetical protein